MILWYAAGSVIAVWLVFQSTGLDFRLVAVGGMIPLTDLVVGHQSVAHSLAAPTVALAAVMAFTSGRGRRLLRRRLIGLAIGWYFGIALSGAFAHREVFWWPAFGTVPGDASVWPSLPWLVVLELLGVGAAYLIFARAGLHDRSARARFLATGRLDLP